MERMCFTFELHEGAADEYKRRHDDTLPELVTAIKEAGLNNYSPYRRRNQMVAYVECEADADAETAFAKCGANEANARWSAWFEDLIVNLTDAKAT